MGQKKIENLIKNLELKEKTNEQKERFIKLITAAVIETKKRKKEMIINGLYNLEFEL